MQSTLSNSWMVLNWSPSSFVSIVIFGNPRSIVTKSFSASLRNFRMNWWNISSRVRSLSMSRYLICQFGEFQETTSMIPFVIFDHLFHFFPCSVNCDINRPHQQHKRIFSGLWNQINRLRQDGHVVAPSIFHKKVLLCLSFAILVF